MGVIRERLSEAVAGYESMDEELARPAVDELLGVVEAFAAYCRLTGLGDEQWRPYTGSVHKLSADGLRAGDLAAWSALLHLTDNAAAVEALHLSVPAMLGVKDELEAATGPRRRALRWMGKALPSERLAAAAIEFDVTRADR